MENLSSKKRVFISGPVSGKPYDSVCEDFKRAQEKLEALGYEVENPIEATKHLDPNTTSHSEFMRITITQLMKCNYITMLYGWEYSRGSQIERQLADTLGIEPLVLTDGGETAQVLYESAIGYYVQLFLKKQGLDDKEFKVSYERNQLTIDGRYVISIDKVRDDIDLDRPVGNYKTYVWDKKLPPSQQIPVKKPYELIKGELICSDGLMPDELPELEEISSEDGLMDWIKKNWFSIINKKMITGVLISDHVDLFSKHKIYYNKSVDHGHVLIDGGDDPYYLCGKTIARVGGAVAVEVSDGVYVKAYDTAQITAYDNSMVYAYNKVKVNCNGKVQVSALKHSPVTTPKWCTEFGENEVEISARDRAIISASGLSKITLMGNSIGYVSGQVTAHATDSSTLIVHGGDVKYTTSDLASVFLA